MRLIPYLLVDGVPFAASQAQVLAHFGPPRWRTRNAVGLTALDYGPVVFRFQDSGRLEEVTRRAPTLVLCHPCCAAPLAFTELAAFVQRHDGGCFQRAGFVVSPCFGLAFVPREPDWVTALAPHCIDTWRAL